MMEEAMAHRKDFTLIELLAVRKSKCAAFTLIELLVVVTIIALLLSILSPVARRAFRLADRDICASNVHQLSLAWFDYQSCNRGWLVVGNTGGSGWARHGNELVSNVNRNDLITTGKLWPHTSRVIGIYLCPADPVPHIRSYSLTPLMRAYDWGDLPYVDTYWRIQDPAIQIVFFEEDDPRSSSNMNSFTQDPKCWNRNRWVDFVANYHNGGDNVGFADGHAEYWTWEDPQTLEASEKQSFYWPDNGNVDLERLRRGIFNGMEGAY